MYSRYIGLCAAEYQMPKERNSSSRKSSGNSMALSTRTRKQIDSLPKHAQHIFTKAHANAVEHTKILPKDEEVSARVLKKSPTRQHGQLLKTNTEKKAING